jgi:hypothetical protein
MGSHAFIKHRGLFFDSERCAGVLRYSQLPATNNGNGCGCARCKKPAKRLYVPEFKNVWRGMQKQFRINWERLDKQALVVIKNG